LKILLDQGLSPGAAIGLRGIGWDALHVSEVGLDCADDLAILAYAKADGFFVITLDHDFHRHLAIGSADGPSVVLLRIDVGKTDRQIHSIRKVCESCQDEFTRGAAVTWDGKKTRVRSLPIRPPTQ
jgi:predicted nuclease of predicted toxin-antitoxin system